MMEHEPRLAAAPPTPDLLLARRAARADARAWEEIVDRYGKRIYNLAYRFAGNPAEAEDLTQEIFLKLYGHLDQYRGDVPLLGWTLRLSRNLCIDSYRRQRARGADATVSDEVLAQLPGEVDVQGESLARESRRLVRRVLAEMPEIHASVLILRDLQGFSYEEIAGYYEVSVGTVKSRLHRARHDLTERLEQRLALESATSPSAAEQASC